MQRSLHRQANITSKLESSTWQDSNSPTMPVEIKSPVNTNKASPDSLYPLPLYDQATHQSVVVDLATRLNLPGEIANMILPGPQLVKGMTWRQRERMLNMFPFSQYRRKMVGDGRKATPFSIQTYESWLETPWNETISLELANLGVDKVRSDRGVENTQDIVVREARRRPRRIIQVFLTDNWIENHKLIPDKLPKNKRAWAFAFLADIDTKDAVQHSKLNLKLCDGLFASLEWEVKAWKGRETRVWWIRREGDADAMDEKSQLFWNSVTNAVQYHRGVYWEDIKVEMEGMENGLGYVDVYRTELAVYMC